VRDVTHQGPLAGTLRILSLCAWAALACANDWGGWRGPVGTGVSAEASGWPAGWPPQRLWTARVGLGCTSPVLADGVLYVTGWSGSGGERPRDNPHGTDTLFAFDARTGRELWRQTQPARYQGRLRTGDTDAYGGPSATPTLDPANGRMFTLGADGALTAWSLHDGGRQLWSLDLHSEAVVRQRPDVGGGTRDFGFTASPRLHGDTLLVEAGSADGLVLAFDPATGARKYTSAARAPAGHSGGFVPLPPAWGDAVAVLALDQLLVLGASDDDAGRVLARAPWATEFGCNIPTPAVHGDHLIVTSGYNQHRTAAFGREADGTLAIRWESGVHAVVSSPVVHGDRVYVLGGSLACLDAATGATVWRGGRFGHGSLVATADDKLVVFGEGRLALVDAAPDATSYRELARVDRVVPGTCYPHVAFADGLIACKDRDGNLAVFSVAPRAVTEVAFTTDDARQTGPARILTFSSDPYHRNFTLGQEGDRVVFRLRTPETGENGMNPETTIGRRVGPGGNLQRVAVRGIDIGSPSR
jgi:outer membrane protein assembly factor BamB